MKMRNCLLLATLCAYFSASAEVVVAPRGLDDRTADLMKEITRLSVEGGGELRLESGDYHFYSRSATHIDFHIANHDQPKERPVFLPLIGVTNVTLKAEGARFVMHGQGTALLLKSTRNVKLRGLTIEWERPYFTEARIVGFGEGETSVVFPERDVVELRDEALTLVGEDWCARLLQGIIFDGQTHEVLYGTGDVAIPEAGYGEDGRILLAADFRKLGAKEGDIILMRDYARPHPVICLDDAVVTAFYDVTFRDGFGMGILAQQSRHIICRNVACVPRSGECASNTIDAIHVANCSGLVHIVSSRFEGMMDDALNVHSTSLAIVDKQNDKTLHCRFMHPQAYGLDLFRPHEHIRLISGKTLENGPTLCIDDVKMPTPYDVILTVEKPIPPEYGSGDAIENADRQCSVVFVDNRVANNRARGVLFTTPKKIICERNIFDHVSGSAILLAGDAQGWYESGACRDVIIRGNTFIDCLTSSYQYCDAVISIYPEVSDIASQKRRYHENICIEKNVFKTYDVPLLHTMSVSNLVWRNNVIEENARYPARNSPRFRTFASDGVTIE